jgi:probable rRNA maturation factor
MPQRVQVSILETTVRECVREVGGARIIKTRLRRGVMAALAAERVRDANISVTLLDDRGIAELNEQYLSHDGPTDVLSFPLYEPNEAPIGDVYIGMEQACRQAAALGVDPLEELTRLAVHGTLHVLGHEHPEGTGREKSAMWKLQERIVAEAMRA